MASASRRGQGHSPPTVNIQYLCQKVQEGNEQAVTECLLHSPDLVNQYDTSTGLTPLHVAARHNYPNIVEILINKSAAVNAESEGQKKTALHIAARLKDRKRQAAMHREESAVNLDDGGGFLDFLGQENEIAPTPTPTETPKTTTELLMSHPEINPNCVDSLKETPLHYAARWGNLNECKVMLEKGKSQINLEVTDKIGRTPLHHSCLHKCSQSKTLTRQLAETEDYHEIATLLVDNGAQVLATDNMLNTPLHLAADEGCLEITKYLLNNARDSLQILLGAQNSDGDTALNLAVRRNHYEVTQHILSKGTDEINITNKNEDTPMHNCEDVSILKKLIENLPDVNACNKAGSTPLHVAAQNGRTQIVAYLLALNDEERRGLAKVEYNNPDNDGLTPLLVASQHGHSAIVSTMLNHPGFDNSARDKNGKTALYLAAENNNLKVLEAMFAGDGPMLDFLEETGTEKLQTPLHIAASNGHIDVVKILIQNGAHVRSKHHGGKTPLHLACQCGHLEVVREILNYDSAAIHDTDDRRNTPLHGAAFYGHYRIVEYLIDNRANLNEKNDKDKTALFLAAETGWRKSCNILLEAGVDVSVRDNTEKTPLQIACLNGWEDVAEVLLEYWFVKKEDGKTFNLLSHRDENGKNCLELAIENGHEGIAEMIVEMKVKVNINGVEEEQGVLKYVLENCRLGDYNTPMRQLIRHMPSVAEMVFNQCMVLDEKSKVAKRIPAGQKVYDEVEFDYTYLDDSNVMMNWIPSSDDTEKSQAEEERLEQIQRQRTYKMYKKTHVLTALASSEKLELLSHPLVSGLLRRKSRGRAMLIFYAQLAVYVVFLAFLTAFMVVSIPPYMFASNYTLVGEGSVCEQLERGGYTQPSYSTVLQYLTLVFAAVLLISEVIQLYQKKKGYFEFENLIEWIIFLFSIIVTVDLSTCSDVTSYRYEWQWSFGTAALFFGWINLALYIQKFPTVGIYIMMFKDILSTFLEFFIVYVLFIIAFALGFYSEMRNASAYENFWIGFVKTSVMMIGELDFGDNFVDGELNNVAASYILFICFVVIMTILVMNLLVGLAVDDIKEIQDKARLKRLQMQVDLVLDLEGVIMVGLCPKKHESMKERIKLTTWHLPFNLNRFIGLESFGITKENILRAKHPEMSDLKKIQDEQQNLKQQNEKLKEKMKAQDATLRSLDDTLKELLVKLEEKL